MTPLRSLASYSLDARWRTDVALALGLGVVELAAVLIVGHWQPERRPLDPLAVSLLALGAAVLVIRRQYPVPTLGLAFAATLAYWLLSYPRGPIFLSMMVVIFTLATGGRRTLAWVSLLAGFVAFLWLPSWLVHEQEPGVPAVFGLAGWMLVLAASAEMVRIRRERELAAVSARAEEARRQISEERVRIAREMHDVLAHSITVINVQASVALHLIDERPEQARTALATIKEVSKETLGELRTVLHALRQGDEPPQRAPTPSLARLDELISRATTAGLQIRTEIAGSLDSLPVGVDLAAYRIVQEALTNVIRHAGAASATVRVCQRDGALTLEVDDEGGPVAPLAEPGSEQSTGRGIVGMRERAAALGGTVEAGPRPEGGFRVLARLPLAGGRPPGGPG
jgi:signal transduction histidine kinase